MVSFLRLKGKSPGKLFHLLLLIMVMASLTACDAVTDAIGITEEEENKSTDQIMKDFAVSITSLHTFPEIIELFHESFLDAGETKGDILENNTRDLSGVSVEDTATLDGSAATITMTGERTDHLVKFNLSADTKVRISTDYSYGSNFSVLDGDGVYLIDLGAESRGSTTVEQYVVVSLTAGDNYVIMDEWYENSGDTYTVSVTTSTEEETTLLGFPYAAGTVRYIEKEGDSKVYYLGWQITNDDGELEGGYAWPATVKIAGQKAYLHGNQSQFGGNFSWGKGTDIAGDYHWSEVNFSGQSYGSSVTAMTISASGGLEFTDWNGDSLGSSVELVANQNDENDWTWYDCDNGCQINLSEVSNPSGSVTVTATLSDGSTETKTSTLDGNEPSSNGTISISEGSGSVTLNWSGWETEGMVSHNTYLHIGDYSSNYESDWDESLTASGSLEVSLSGFTYYYGDKSINKFVDGMLHTYYEISDPYYYASPNALLAPEAGRERASRRKDSRNSVLRFLPR